MDRSEFEMGHIKQTAPVCVLMSYAVALFPSSRKPAADYMIAYCREYGRIFSNTLDAERLVGCYFGADACANRLSGYDHLRRVHDTFKDTIFEDARKLCTLSDFKAIDPLNELQNFLRANALHVALISWNTEDGQHPHSVALSFDAKLGGFSISDPNHGALGGPLPRLEHPLDVNTGKPLIIGDILILSPLRVASP